MFTLLTAGPNLPFSVAPALILPIAALEGVGWVLGSGFAALLDELIPGLDIDADAPDIGEHGIFGQLLG